MWKVKIIIVIFIKIYPILIGEKMSKTYIFGHKSPDTDSITSSLVMADLESKLGNDVVACRLGSLNKED